MAMLKFIWVNLKLFLVMTLLTGVIYPLTVTGIAQVAFPGRANGSLVYSNGKAVGSSLIGQYFNEPRYFWGRPSATQPEPYVPFDAHSLSGGTGSNLGPLSASLQKAVQARAAALQAADPGNTSLIPVDLVTASGSGLDPDISIAAALYQAPRVARARGLAAADVIQLVNSQAQPRQLGILGERRVNVLELNIALDKLDQVIP